MDSWEFCKVEFVVVKSSLFGASTKKLVASLITPRGYEKILESEPVIGDAPSGELERMVELMAAELGLDGWEPVKWHPYSPVFKRRRP